MSTDKFKVGDKVRCIKDHLKSLTFDQVYTVARVQDGRYAVRNDLGCVGLYPEYVFKVVESTNEYLTPEEVFNHLRIGTKLEYKLNNQWCTFSGDLGLLAVKSVLDYEWRIKHEPEIITLNGKRYQAL